MYQISKEFTFSASHRLLGLPAEHPCSRLHGHNYVVRLVLERTRLTVPTGFVVDFNELSAFGDYLDEYFDHRDLNEVLTVNPTAENLARHFYVWSKRHWVEIASVAVSETPKTWAFYDEA